MKSVEPPFDLLLTSPGQRVAIPGWMRALSPHSVSPRSLAGHQVKALHGLPAVTVVKAKRPRTIIDSQTFLSTLADRHARTAGPAKILFVFESRTPKTEVERLPEVLCHFSRLDEVDFAYGPKQAEFALQGKLAKVALQHYMLPTPPPSDPLGELQAIISATSTLRAKSGRLSAAAVAETFGLPKAELARLLGKTRQAISKTDDASSIQDGLEPFARAARLRSVLPEDDFRAWLHLPNANLGDRQPIDLIKGGRVDVVADLAENMLVGNPA